MKKLAVIVIVDVAFVFRCVVGSVDCDNSGGTALTSLAAAAATFYNSVSSVFEIEATVRTGQEDGGAKGGREEGGTVRVKNISIQIQCQCEREAKSV